MDAMGNASELEPALLSTLRGQINNDLIEMEFTLNPDKPVVRVLKITAVRAECGDWDATISVGKEKIYTKHITSENIERELVAVIAVSRRIFKQAKWMHPSAT